MWVWADVGRACLSGRRGVWPSFSILAHKPSGYVFSPPITTHPTIPQIDLKPILGHKDGKKPGQKKGHKGVTRPPAKPDRQVPDRQVEVTKDQCHVLWN